MSPDTRHLEPQVAVTGDRRAAQDLVGWLAVGVVGFGGASMLGQVLEVGPQQCLLRSATGVPCPLCGMSTVARRLIEGDVVGAVRLDALGVALLVVVGAVALLQLGRALRLTSRAVPVGFAVGGASALLAAHWIATVTGAVDLVPLVS